MDVTDCCIESQKARERGQTLVEYLDERDSKAEESRRTCYCCNEKIENRWSKDYVDFKHATETCRLCGTVAHAVYCSTKKHWWRFKGGPTCEDCTAKAVDNLYDSVDSHDSSKSD